MQKQAGYVRHFKELEVYRRQQTLSKTVFELSKTFPREEQYALTDQIRRSSRSVGAQLAEAWAKRRYPKHFISKLTDADGEQMETQHWTMEAETCGYLSAAHVERLLGLCEEIGRMLSSMMRKADTFASRDYNTAHEDPIPYLTTEDNMSIDEN